MAKSRDKPVKKDKYEQARKAAEKLARYKKKYSDKSTEYIALVIEYDKLAKKADSRLRSLEALSHEEYYRGVKNYAYARAIRDIEAWSGTGAKRFQTKPPESIQGLQGKIMDIKTFLLSETSTKRGITETYKKRADTINKKYGTNFTWQDLARYYTSKTHEIASKSFGSRTELMAYAVLTRKITHKDVSESIYVNASYIAQELKKMGWKPSAKQGRSIKKGGSKKTSVKSPKTRAKGKRKK